jgi:hypothetical protein
MTILLWIIHALLLISIAQIARNKSIGDKIAVTIYLFYTVAPLFPIKYHQFSFVLDYNIEDSVLLSYICLDIFFLFSIFLVSKYFNYKDINFFSKSDSDRGKQSLMILAMLAFIVHVIMNFDLFLLSSKAQYIISNRYPNLFYFTIPAEGLLMGGLFFNPFKNKFLRFSLGVTAIASILLLIFMGYRFLVLATVLFLLFKLLPKMNILIVVFLLTTLGEFSNMVKEMFRFFLIDFKIPTEFLSNWYDHILRTGFISSEQKAILTNTVIGLSDLNFFMPLKELQNLIPFINRIIGPVSISSAGRIGVIAGAPIDAGGGTAYSLVLFLIESAFIGALFLTQILILVHYTSKSIFVFVALNLFFSLMRDTPEYWAGQLKMLIILIVFVYFLNFIFNYIEDKDTRDSVNKKIRNVKIRFFRIIEY